MNAPLSGRPMLTAGFIMSEVARTYGIDIRMMKSPRRARAVARPRQVAMWLISKLIPGMSLPAIGATFGNRDHSSVMHAVARVEALADSDAYFFAVLEILKDRIVEATRSDPQAPNVDARARRLGHLLTELSDLIQDIDPDTLSRTVQQLSKGRKA